MSAQIIQLPTRRNTQPSAEERCNQLLDILESTTTMLRARKGKPPLPPASASFQPPVAQRSAKRVARLQGIVDNLKERKANEAPSERQLADRLEAVCRRTGALPAIAPRTARQKHLERARLLHDLARDLGMSITVHPQGGAT